MANTQISEEMLARMYASFPKFVNEIHDLYFDFPQQFKNLPENPTADQIMKEYSSINHHEPVGHKRVIFHR